VKEWIRPFYLKWLYFRLHPEAKPAQWNRCWEFPAVSLSGSLPGPGEKADVLILPMTDWHTRIQRAQHFARQLAALGHRCFYLNPNLGREFPQPALLSSALAVHRIEEGIYEIHLALPREPVYHHRLLSEAESRAVAAHLERTLAAFASRRLAIVSQFPLWNRAVELLRRRRPAVLVSDCHDLLGGFRRMSREIIAAEELLFQQAEILVFSAKSLLEKKRAEFPWLEESLGKSVEIIPNGAEVSHFQWSAESKQRIVGYAGSLDEWFDVDAVQAAAQANPQAQFVLLGRIEDEKVRTLEALSNVRLYGEVPYHRLPTYLSEFDVGLIPFLVNPLTLATNPIKLYEYFACGMPVVSSHLPEVAAYGSLVYTASTPEEFAAQVSRALAEQDPERRRRRRVVAEGESWPVRAAQLSRAIESR
jgi:glycosyltransferase involved in cell wall biosynthesis